MALERACISPGDTASQTFERLHSFKREKKDEGVLTIAFIAQKTNSPPSQDSRVNKSDGRSHFRLRCYTFVL